MWNLGKLQILIGGSWPAHSTRESLRLSRVQGIGLFLLLSQWSCVILLVGNPMEKRIVLNHMKQKKGVQQGTLALMVLKTLDVLGPLHGYAVARRIEQISGDLLSVNQGTLYPVLLRLEQEGAITSDWATSDNNRRARFYRLTRMGYKLLESEKRDWEETAVIIARFFEVKAEDFA
jgi:PadR family transcriptional regulator PadR